MKDQLFDEFIKDKLGQYDSGAPMQVWERIREKEKDDKKGFFFFRRFWLTGIALVAFMGIGFLTWKAGPGTNFSKPNQEKNNQAETNNPKNNSAQIITESDHKLNEQKEPVTKETTTNANGPHLLTNETANKEQTKNQSENSVAVAESSLKPGETAVNNNLIRKNNTSTTKLETGKKLTQQKSNEIKKPGNQLQEDYRTPSAEVKEYTLSFTANTIYRGTENNFQLGNVPLPDYRPSCPTINGPRRNDLYIEVYGSPDYTMRRFSNPPALNSYIASRRTSEDNRNGFSAGVRFAKNVGEKTVIKGGINYSQINERLRIITQNEKQITQIITIRTVIRAPGDTLFIRDTTYFEQSGTRYRTTHNRYRFIDLPVIFSYEFGNPEILAFSVNAGPVFNITSFYHGEVLDTTLTPVKISTAKGTGANNWRSNIGIGVFASFAVYKRINERLQIFGEPYFRYNFKPVTQNKGFVAQRYATSGMQLGIRYNLYNGRQRYR